MGIAVALTILSMVDYFYHARDVLVGPWSSPPSEAAARRQEAAAHAGVATRRDRAADDVRLRLDLTVGTELVRDSASTRTPARSPSRSSTCRLPRGRDRERGRRHDVARRRARSVSCARDALVVVTGGLGPTHDDITREAAARGARPPLARDPDARRRSCSRRHGAIATRAAVEQVLRQADVLEGAACSCPRRAPRPAGHPHARGAGSSLLPGPPAEMRPDARATRRPNRAGTGAAPPTASWAASASPSPTRRSRLRGRARALPRRRPHGARAPGDVRVVLFDEGRGRARSTLRRDASLSGSRRVAVLLDRRVDARRGGRAPATRARAHASASPSPAPAAWSPRRSPTSRAPRTCSSAVSSRTRTRRRRRCSACRPDTLDRHGAVSAETAAEMAAGALAALRRRHRGRGDRHRGPDRRHRREAGRARVVRARYRVGVATTSSRSSRATAPPSASGPPLSPSTCSARDRCSGGERRPHLRRHPASRARSSTRSRSTPATQFVAADHVLARREVGPGENLHVTLKFIGNVAEDDARSACRRGRRHAGAMPVRRSTCRSGRCAPCRIARRASHALGARSSIRTGQCAALAADVERAVACLRRASPRRARVHAACHARAGPRSTAR